MNTKQFLKMLKVAAEEDELQQPQQPPQPQVPTAPDNNPSRWQSGLAAALDAPLHMANRLWETGLVGNAVDLGIKGITGANKVLGNISEYYTGHRITPIKNYRRGYQDIVNGRNADGKTIGAEDYARDFEQNLAHATGSDRIGRWGGNALRAAGWLTSAQQAAAEFLATRGMTGAPRAITLGAAKHTGMGARLANAGIKALRARTVLNPIKITAQGTKDLMTHGGQEAPETSLQRGVVKGSDYVESTANLAPVYASGGAFGIPSWVTTAATVAHGSMSREGVAPSVFSRMIPALSPDLMGDAAQKEEQQILADIDTKPEVRGEIAQSLGLPSDAPAATVKEQLRSAIPAARMNRVLPEAGYQLASQEEAPEALKLLNENENWASIPQDKLRPYILENYGQEAWADAQYKAMKYELQRGGLVDKSMWGRLDGLSADQMIDLFSLVVRNEDRSKMGFAEGNGLMQWLRGEDTVLQNFINMSPQHEDQMVAFAAKVCDMKRNGQWNPQKDTSDKLVNTVMSNLSAPACAKLLDPIVSTWSAEELASLAKGGGKLPKPVNDYITRKAIDRAAVDGNFAAGLGMMLKDKATDLTMSDDPVMQKYIAKSVKGMDPKKFFSTMDIDHFSKAIPMFVNNADSTTSPIAGVSDDEWAKLKTDFIAAAKSRAWSLLWENPIKNLPALAGMLGAMNGFSGGAVDAISNPLLFWGVAALLLGGGWLLASRGGGDDDDDDDSVTAAALKRQRELLANADLGGMI